MRVSNCKNKSGKPVANQFLIKEFGKVTFQSYDKIVAIKQKASEPIPSDYVILDPRYIDFSRTTSKYLSLFLGETMKTIKEKIANGTYSTAYLN